MISGNNVFIDYDGERLLFSHPDPANEDGDEYLAYILIHGNDPLKRSERLRAASVIQSYSQLINRETNKTRNKKVNAIKQEIKDAAKLKGKEG